MNFFDIIVRRSEQKFVTFSPLNMTRLISIAAEKNRLILFQLPVPFNADEFGKCKKPNVLLHLKQTKDQSPAVLQNNFFKQILTFSVL
jgi:hypothetical protein